MRRRRVKITGIGPVTPAGVGRDAFWQGIQEPISRIRSFEKLGEEWGPFVAATVDDQTLRDCRSRESLPKHMARHTWFGVVGALLAIEDAGIDAASLSDRTWAFITGTSIMDFGGITRGTESVAKKGIRGVMPRLVYSASVANVATSIAQVMGVGGRTLAVQSSCCSGLDAIGQGAEAIASGSADIVIAGGSEAPLFKHRAAGLTPSTVERAESSCRPFDLWRTTGTISEGAAMFVLEPEESPRTGYCWIDGHAFANDDEGDLCGGLGDSIEESLANADTRRGEIDVINAWAPGHRQIDAAEAAVMGKVFGHDLARIFTHSIKGAVGNALGGAPAIQVAASVLGLRHQSIPPTVNWEFPDPACPLHLSADSEAFNHRKVLINAHGLAGMNSSLVLSRCP